jgi:hypothetical protein
MIAVARVRPSKSIHEVEVAAVKKNEGQSSSHAVNRGDIMRRRLSCGKFSSWNSRAVSGSIVFRACSGSL